MVAELPQGPGTARAGDVAPVIRRLAEFQRDLVVVVESARTAAGTRCRIHSYSAAEMARADPAAFRARAVSCPAFRAQDPASPARRSAPLSALSRSCWAAAHPLLSGPLGLSAVGSPVTGSGSPRYPGSAAAHSHSPDGARLRTSCPVLAIGGLRSGYRRSVTGRRRVAGTGAFRRPDDHPAGSGIARRPGGALRRRGYPHVHSLACPHVCRGLSSVFTQIIHRPIHRGLVLAGQRAAGEHESREKAVIPRYTFPPGGREMTVTRIAC